MLKKIINWLVAPCMPMYFGGKSKSTSSNTTTNTTVNNVDETDNRIIASDQAIAISGSNNQLTKSETTNNLTSFLSNTTTTDSGNTTFTDNSSRTDTTNFTYTTTDFGSVGAALSTVNQFGMKAIDSSTSLIDKTFAYLKGQSAANLNQAAGSIDFATSASANAKQTSANVIEFASNEIKETKMENKFLIYAGALLTGILIWKKL